MLQSSEEKNLLQKEGKRGGGKLSTKDILEVIFEICVTGFGRSEMVEE